MSVCKVMSHARMTQPTYPAHRSGSPRTTSIILLPYRTANPSCKHPPSTTNKSALQTENNLPARRAIGYETTKEAEHSCAVLLARHKSRSRESAPGNAREPENVQPCAACNSSHQVEGPLLPPLERKRQEERTLTVHTTTAPIGKNTFVPQHLATISGMSGARGEEFDSGASALPAAGDESLASELRMARVDDLLIALSTAGHSGEVERQQIRY